MEGEIRSLIGQLREISEMAKSLMKEDKQLYGGDLVALLNEYSDASISFSRIAYGKSPLRLRSLQRPKRFSYGSARRIFIEMSVECMKGTEYLEAEISAIPARDLDKLKSLREDLKAILQDLPDPDLEKNVVQAIDEYEKGCFLGSALIFGRVVTFVVAKIPGADVDEKIRYLREKQIIGKEEKDVEQHMIKGNKKSRDVLSHDLRNYPDSSEALSMLTESVILLKVLSKASKTGAVSLS